MEKILKMNGIMIPNKIIENQSLTTFEKILFGLISTIQDESGCAFTKTNRILALIFSKTPQTISKSINKLEREGFIIIQYKQSPNKTTVRYIWKR